MPRWTEASFENRLILGTFQNKGVVFPKLSFQMPPFITPSGRNLVTGVEMTADVTLNAELKVDTFGCTAEVSCPGLHSGLQSGNLS